MGTCEHKLLASLSKPKSQPNLILRSYPASHPELRPCRVWSAWNVVVQQRNDIAGKWEDALLCRVGGFAGIHCGGNAHQGSVAAVHPHGVRHQVELCPIFAGEAAVMGPIPVEDQLARVALGNNIAAGRKWSVPGQRNRDGTGLYRSPTCSGQAVLGRVDRVASALAAEIGDEEIHVGLRFRLVLINPQKKVAWPEHIENILLYGNVGAGPRVELQGKRLQRKARGENLVTPARLQEDGCGSDQNYGEDKAHARSHFEFASRSCQMARNST